MKYPWLVIFNISLGVQHLSAAIQLTIPRTDLLKWGVTGKRETTRETRDKLEGGAVEPLRVA